MYDEIIRNSILVQNFYDSYRRKLKARICVFSSEEDRANAKQAASIMVQEVETQEAYDEAKAGSKLVVFDFYADWCGPCKMIAPEIEKLSKDADMIAAGVKFYKVNVDKLDRLAAKEGISAMPTFLIFKGGKEVERCVGARLEAIKNALAKHM